MNQNTLFPGVNYRLGPTRQLPVSGDYLTTLMDAVKRTNPGLTIDITSAGQVPVGTPGPRTGSDRHDVDHSGHGHTSDLVLVRDGKPIRPGEDKELYARFLQNAAAAGFQGIGHYEWGVHVGGGSQAMWGPTTGGNSIDPVFAQAIKNGWAGNWAAGSVEPAQAPTVPKFETPDSTATPMNPSGASFSFSGVVEAGAGFTTVKGSDGLNYTFKGSRNWRNNNPGNIEFGDFAQSMGAVSKPTAKTLLQFRSFMLASWSKQFLNGMNHLDFTTFASFATTAFLGSMTYTLREYLNSIGRPDQQEHLADRLSPQRLVTSGLQNSSWMGVMAPAIETAWTSVGQDPLFDGRSTQQSSNAFLGNPTVGLYDAVTAIPKALRSGINGEFSQADLRKLKTVLVFQNAMGVTQMFNVMAGALPE